MRHHTRYILFSSAICLLSLLGCGGGATNTIKDRNLGESCNLEHDCANGLYCDNGVCRNICSNDRECLGNQVCKGNRCITINDGTCRSGWYGPNCSFCAPDFYGLHCDHCPKCEQGKCNDSMNGDGTCQCFEGWSGDLCSIPPLCQHGTPDANRHCKTGSCQNNWTGEDCDICPAPFYDANCTKKLTCQHGDANTDPHTGDGHCLSCNDGFWGQDCDKTITCQHGDANTDPLTGDGRCLSCFGNWAPGPDNNCNHCLDGWTDADCNICARGFYGTQCFDCSKTPENNTYYGQSECTFTDDRQNNISIKYDLVRINDQLWMDRNMAFQKDVNCIIPPSDSSYWQNYGCLYTFEDAQNVCPADWRLPTKNDFETLLNYVRENKTSTEDYLALSAGSNVWDEYNGQPANEFGFSALPAGFLWDEDFQEPGSDTYFWTSTTNWKNSNIYRMGITFGISAALYENKGNEAISVRCLKRYCEHGIVSPDNDGHCIKNSCTGNFTGDYCDKCKFGWFGENCDECKFGWAGDLCDKCAPGFYGSDCLDCSKTSLYFGKDECTISDNRTNPAKKYRVVKIGSQLWMAQNLAYDPGNGFCLTNTTEYGDPDFLTNIGCLYTWDNAQNICPAGWRLPTQDDFETLLGYVEENKTAQTSALALNSTSTWIHEEKQANDEFGFSALPSGYFFNDDYLDFGNSTSFWSQTSDADDTATTMLLFYSSSSFFPDKKTNGNSVRCLKE